jgi:beta-glucosidase
MYNNKVLMYSAPQFYVPGYGLQQVLEHLKQSYGNPPIYIHENGKYFATIVYDDN